jgi:adenosine deaminase
LDEKEFAEADALRHSLEHCQSAGPQLACGVETRWLYQVLRGFPPEQVFAQTVLAFEVAKADKSVVGLNFVMPEDGRLSMRDYHLQMRMLDYLHSVYPAVHIALHAGELRLGLVPPAGLAFHIREAIELGHAERIGHGADVLYEDHPSEILKELAERRIMVEINLTSNDVILGVKGADSPLAEYRAANVPVALSTDDEGVSRIDLTHEFVRGAEEQNLTYADLKQMARTSLEHAFLPGESFDGTNSPCRQPHAAASKPSAPCAAFLKASEKAAQQWELERRLVEFEASLRNQ